MASISATSQQTTASLTVTASASRSGGTVTSSCPWTLKANYPGPYYSWGKVNGDTVKTVSNNTSNDGFTHTGTKTVTDTEYGAKTYSIPIAVHAQGYSGGGTLAKTTTGTVSVSIGAAKFTVTFDKNGGDTPSMAGKEVTYGQTFGTLATCSRTGYNFAGWFTAAEGGTEVKSSDTVAITADTTLYAHWTAKSITATFKLQGGKIGGSAEDVTRTETYDSAWVLPADPTRDGYTFAGWYTAASGGTQITNATTVSVASNTTVYAQWTGNEVTCTYDARGGTVNPAGKTVTVGSAYGELPTPTRAGYRFLGWWATVLGNTEITPESTVTATGNHTIYARWEPLSVLRYVGGGEAKTITNIKVVESGTVRNIVGCYSVESGVVKQGV